MGENNGHSRFQTFPRILNQINSNFERKINALFFNTDEFTLKIKFFLFKYKVKHWKKYVQINNNIYKLPPAAARCIFSVSAAKPLCSTTCFCHDRRVLSCTTCFHKNFRGLHCLLRSAVHLIVSPTQFDIVNGTIAALNPSLLNLSSLLES